MLFAQCEYILQQIKSAGFDNVSEHWVLGITREWMDRIGEQNISDKQSELSNNVLVNFMTESFNVTLKSSSEIQLHDRSESRLHPGSPETTVVKPLSSYIDDHNRRTAGLDMSSQVSMISPAGRWWMQIENIRNVYLSRAESAAWMPNKPLPLLPRNPNANILPWEETMAVDADSDNDIDDDNNNDNGERERSISTSRRFETGRRMLRLDVVEMCSESVLSPLRLSLYEMERISALDSLVSFVKSLSKSGHGKFGGNYGKILIEGPVSVICGCAVVIGQQNIKHVFHPENEMQWCSEPVPSAEMMFLEEAERDSPVLDSKTRSDKYSGSDDTATHNNVGSMEFLNHTMEENISAEKLETEVIKDELFSQITYASRVNADGTHISIPVQHIREEITDAKEDKKNENEIQESHIKGIFKGIF